MPHVNRLHLSCVLPGQTVLHMTELLLLDGIILARIGCVTRAGLDTVCEAFQPIQTLWGTPVNLQTGLMLVSLGPALAATRLMALTGTVFQSHPSLPYGFPAIRECEPYKIETPTGTVSIVVDRPKGVMDIFAEHDPHPLDWAVAVQMIKQLAYPEDLGEPDYLKGIDTWRISLKS